MQHKYLKIGELARLKGVSVKALRYYDRIGILKPARVSEKTGYRYYAPEQMIVLDIIQLCLTFQLPLKALGGGDGAPPPDLKGLILQGETQARKQLREAEKMLTLSRDILDQIQRLDQPREERSLYTQPFPRRQVLTRPWDSARDSGEHYIDKIASLYQSARDSGLTILTQQGLLLDRLTGASSVFLAVEGASPGPECRTFPASDYACMILDEGELASVPALLSEKGISARYAFCLNTDIYDYCLVHHLHRLEVQCPLSGAPL